MGRHTVRQGLRSLLLQCLLIAALGCVPRECAAQALNLNYFADATCPDQAAFERAVRAKSTAPVAETAAGQSSRIAVRLSAVGAGFVGQLKLERAALGSYEREVNGSTCSEVANALAFVLALAVSAKDPLTTAASARGAPPTLQPPRLIGLASERPKPSWRMGGGAQLGVRGGLAPVLPVVESVFLVAQRPSPGPFGLELRLGFEHAQPTSRIGSDAAAEFGWWSGRADVCPLALRLERRLAFLPCLGAHLGRITAHGRPVVGEPRDAARLWGDALAAGRLELSLLRQLRLEAQGDLLLPLSRYQFAFDPHTNVYQVPKVAAAGFIGLTVSFP